MTSTALDQYPSRLGRPPEFLERTEPVVYPGVPGPLTDEQVAAFDRDGYVVVPALFGPDEVQKLDLAVEECIADAAFDDPAKLIVEPGSDEIRSVFAFHHRTDALGEVVGDVRMAGVARQLLGSQVYIHQSRVNCKPGFRGKDFQWHSDFETWHTEDGMPTMRCVSASLWLTDNHEWNGPLLVIPGSHRAFVTCTEPTPDANHESSLRAQTVGVPDEASLTRLFEQAGIDTCTGPAGSVVFFDCNLMHGSPSNVSPLARRNLFVVYNSVDNELTDPFSAPARRPEHIASRTFTPV